MFFHSFTDQGIVVKRRNFGEADRWITLLTANYGLVTSLAKSVRKIESKKSGHLELLNLIDFKIARHTGAGVIIETEVKKDFSFLKNDLNLVQEAYFLCEICNRLLPEEEKNFPLFEKLKKTLENLNQPQEDKKKDLDLKDFEIFILHNSGFWDENMFKDKRPQTTEEWRRFNRIFIEQITGSPLKSPKKN